MLVFQDCDKSFITFIKAKKIFVYKFKFLLFQSSHNPKSYMIDTIAHNHITIKKISHEFLSQSIYKAPYIDKLNFQFLHHLKVR